MLDATPPGANMAVVVADSSTEDPPRMLHYNDDGGFWAFQHVCVRPDATIRVAPRLTSEHNVVLTPGPEVVVTVTPSILCPDCGLHGFVERSTWVQA